MTSSVQDSSYVMVCAVDFGTTYSGYAFSSKANPYNPIYMNKNWGSEVSTQAFKTPTCVLTSPSGEFVAFGFEAEKIYSEEIEDDPEAERRYNLFRHFKMILHSEKKLGKNTKMKATNGKEQNALEIFAHALKYLKDHMLKAVANQVAHVLDVDLIRWVLTVPAIWTEESKQFMREAAYKAGCIAQKDSRKLVIALEPEAASLCCRRVEIAQYPEGSDLSNFIQPHAKYLIIDCGGGTVDITAHEILSDNSIRELRQASGGPWGGTKVDAYFIHLLEDVLGKRFIETYRTRSPQQWLNLMIHFETAKRAVTLKAAKSVNIPLNMEVEEQYRDIIGGGASITKAVNQCRGSGLSITAGHIRINPAKTRALFEPVIQNIIDHVNDLLQEPEIEGCQYFFLVGGFSQSPILQEMIKQEFSNRVNVLIPEEAQMAVVKGAVMFGHRPSEIKSRVARKTYGCNIVRAIDDMHPSEYVRSKVRTVDGQKVCEDIFHTFVAKDEELEVGETRKFNARAPKGSQKCIIKLFSMDRCPKTEGVVDFVDDQGVKQVGAFLLDTPQATKGDRRDVILYVTFGGTEIQIEAECSGKKVTAKIDFLSES